MLTNWKQTQFLDAFSGKTCQNPEVTPFDAHIMHRESDAGGAGKFLLI